MFRKHRQKQPYNGLRPHVAAWEREIQRLAGRNEILCQVADKVRGPQIFTFRLHLADPGHLSKLLSMEEQLALVLGVPSVRVARHLGLVHLEIALPGPFHRPLPVRALNRKGGSWVTLGQTAVGTPVHINLAGTRTCHALVSGITGSGKTIAEQLIAWTLATDNEPNAVNLLLIDGKGGTAWWGFERLPHLPHPVIGDPGEAIAALTWCVAELDRRKTNGQRRPALFVVVDEVRELLDAGGEPVAEAIRRVAALGRDLGIHIVVATQHALVDNLGGSIAKANLPLRLTGRVADATAAYVATGVKSSGAEMLQGNGDFIVTVAGVSHRLQVAMLTNREIGRLPRVEITPRLDFGDYDPARVLDVVDKPGPDPVEPDQVAVALASGKGITWLANELGVGSSKARRVREFAQLVADKLAELGYTIIPTYHPPVAEPV